MLSQDQESSNFMKWELLYSLQEKLERLGQVFEKQHPILQQLLRTQEIIESTLSECDTYSADLLVSLLKSAASSKDQKAIEAGIAELTRKDPLVAVLEHQDIDHIILRLSTIARRFLHDSKGSYARQQTPLSREEKKESKNLPSHLQHAFQQLVRLIRMLENLKDTFESVKTDMKDDQLKEIRRISTVIARQIELLGPQKEPEKNLLEFSQKISKVQFRPAA